MKTKVFIFGFPIISIIKGAKVVFGKNITLISASYFSEPGINHPVIIRLLKKESSLKLGDNIGISGGGICVENRVIIEDNVMLGANVFITDTDFHPIDPNERRFRRDNVISKEVIIKKNVFIGMNAIILKGVTIGENSVIGANSVVTKNIPANVIAAGNPCKVVKTISEYEKFSNQ